MAGKVQKETPKARAARGRKRAQRMFPVKECEACGSTEKLSRHHRDGNPMNNARENVVILCLGCHTTEEWQSGTYANRPTPVIVRDSTNGRILGTRPSIPNRTARATQRWATPSPSLSQNGSGGGS